MFKRRSKSAGRFTAKSADARTVSKKADAGASFVVESAEGTMRFSGYSSEGPEGAALRDQVARRRDRLFGLGGTQSATRA